MKTSIFLSYCWANETVADTIDNDFDKLGITLVRDKRDVPYKKSFSEFMKKVRQTDFAIMLISDDYLKSRNCMYEMKEFIKDENFRDKLLPVIIRGANIFDAVGIAEYIIHWERKVKDLEEHAKKLPPTTSSEIVKELKILSEISMNIGEYLGVVKDMHCFPLDKLKSNNYQDILNLL